jgi:hypothetical protein
MLEDLEYVSTTRSAGANDTTGGVVFCSSGKNVLGGGYDAPPPLKVVASQPNITSGTTANGWVVQCKNETGTAIDFTVFAVAATTE